MNEKRVIAAAVTVVAIGPLGAISKLTHAQDFGCGTSARLLRYACTFDARDDLHTRRAQCEDSSVPDLACLDDADAAFDESLEECGDVYDARLDVCDALDDDVHEPMFGEDFATDFVDPTEIGVTVAPNPFFALVAGNIWVYEGPEETITVTVTARTKRIDGIDCVVVNDLVTDEDDVVVEDTDDWYAQDLAGNVWYCGEIAENYELFDGDDPEVPELTDIDGSWKHGRDRAKAGLLLPFEPVVGDVIRQEVRYNDAEDLIEIVSITASEVAPAAACVDNCLQTRDFTPLEPGVNEHKFYAPGIGLIVEINLEDGERVELVEFVGVGS